MPKKTIQLGKAAKPKRPKHKNHPAHPKADQGINPMGTPKKPNRRNGIDTSRMEEQDSWLGKITHPKKRVFLIAYAANGGNLCNAADAAGISYNLHYAWLDGRSDKNGMGDYREAFEEAKVRNQETIRMAVHQRGIVGLRRLKFTAKGDAILDPDDPTGRTPYEERQYSDNLLIKAAEAKVPEFIEAKKAAASNVNIQNNNATVIQGVRLYLPDNGRGDAAVPELPIDVTAK